MRLRSRLLILITIVLLPTVLGAVFAISYVYQEQQKAYRRSIQELARAMAIVLDKEIRERESLLKLLAASPALKTGDLESFYVHATALASSWDTTIILSDLSGQQLLNTRVPLGTKDLPHSRPLMPLRERLGPEASVVSDVYFAPIGKSHSFAMQIPVKINGELKYYLAIGSFTSHLQDVFKGQQMMPGWVTAIIDRNGTVAARSHEPEKFVGKQVSPGLRNAFAQQNEGFYEGTGLTGIPVTAFFSRAPTAGWGFVVAVPRAQLQQTAVHAMLLMSGVFILMLILAIAAAVLVGRKIAKPMESLRRAAGRMGQGEAVAARQTGILEIDSVNLEMARASEQIRNTRAELEHRVAEAVAAAERSHRALLQGQKLEALGRLTGGIAHDFNNVLQTLTTGLQVVLMRSQEPGVRKAIESCQRAVQRAAELVRQLMAFGRVQEAHLSTIDLGRQIEEILPMLKSGLRSDIDLQVEVEAGLWPVTIDALLFELAMLNLTINARDAMASGGMLRIAMCNRALDQLPDNLPPGDYVQIAVADTGAGMEEEVLGRALEPYFTTKKLGHGSGMGLSQVYGFVKQAGGALSIDSDPGKGTVVTLYLPRAAACVATAPSSQARLVPGPVSGKVLLVEDDPLVSVVVRPALEAAGLDVRVAMNGDEALAILAGNESFDVVFSDVVMPGMTSGIELAHLIREQHPDTAIVLATGYSEQRISLPHVRVLAKPYETADVVQVLRGELTRKREHAAARHGL
ncbi:hybrid sensor histidine kinase/response regulator [Noviherbaspirillum massiliense]|uniref:hybrid sensor histidine kinase/response regulator n=1 Tax=Noviherbaspirillum massiliense TaxID=1465823 RepID=UPI0003032A91|nr:response regulator [Noviherbaspirillum massiliense]